MLILSVLRCPDAVPPETKRVSGGEFKIGRGPDNDWVMLDPDRMLSKRHCVVAFRNGGWAIADTSTNGTYLNRDAQPLGSGQVRGLTDGDRIRFGAYEIEVRIEEDRYAAAPPRPASSAGSSPFDDPFGDDVFAPKPAPRDNFTASAFGSDPLFGGPSPQQSVSLPQRYDPLSAATDDDFFGSPTVPDHSQSFSDAFKPPPVAPKLIPDDDWDLGFPAAPPNPPAAPSVFAPPQTSPAYAPPPPRPLPAQPMAPSYPQPLPQSYAPQTAPPVAPQSVPFGFPEPLPPAYPPPASAPPLTPSYPQPLPQSYAPQSAPLGFPEPLPSAYPPPAPPPMPGYPQPLPQSYAPQTAPPGAPQGVPLGFPEPPPPAYAAPIPAPPPSPGYPQPLPQSYAPQAAPPGAPQGVPLGFPEPPPRAYAPPPPMPPMGQPVQSPVPSALPSASPFAEPEDFAPAPPRAASVPPMPPPAALPAVPQTAPAHLDSDALLLAFLEGAGMQGARLEDPAGSMRALGAAFRATVAGIRQALIARSSIKGEFRIEQTMIRARGNNPLKFSADDDDALGAMLGVGRRTDVTPQAAIADALRDMRLHELATMAAMQDAVRAMLAQLDPVRLKAEGEAGGGILPAQKKARAFEAYEKLHNNVTRALADDFDSVFGKSFARAYEAALRDISAKDRP